MTDPTPAHERDKDMTGQQLRRNFLWFAFFFSLNHGLVTTPLVISTTVLAGGVGYVGNALINVFTVVSAFFLGAPVVGGLGLKGATLFGMVLYCVYVGLFAVAAFAGTEAKEVQMVAFGTGSVCGGIAAGVLWTAQGGYFSRTVDFLLKQEGGQREALTATLGGSFAVLYLGLEVFAKLAWSALDRLQIDGMVIAAGFMLLGLFATAMMTRVLNLTTTGPAERCSRKLRAAAMLWRDPIVLFISGLNLTFGFSAAFMGGYINAHFTSRQLGSFAVPLLAALTALLAAILARVFGSLAACVGKGPLVVVGALSFLGIPLCFFALSCCEEWGWWLVVLYILQGSGRAVFESINKSIFADMFPNDSVGAFANSMLQSSLAFALCFFLSESLTGPVLAIIALCLSVVTPFGYLAAMRLRAVRMRMAGAMNNASENLC